MTAFNTCGEVADSIFVSYNYMPGIFDLGPDTMLCPGESLILHSPITNGETLTWQDGSHDNTLMVSQPGTYSLTLTNACGTSSDTITISTDDRLPIIDLPLLLTWCDGQDFVLDATQGFVAQYLWSTGESTPTIMVAMPGIYSVDVSAPCAVANDEITIVPNTVCDTARSSVFIPNVFSPNGDQVNDAFTVSFHPDMTILGLTGTIYDRWGNVLFQSKQHPFSWDGTRNEQLVNPGVYVYKFTIAYRVGSREVVEQITGDVTVIQ
jgi:gliding motility-associated-like protein